jgi:periplasmic divalent cation tolerance protein
VSEYKLVYITTPTLDEATRIGRAMVDQRLAACANILPGMKSIYRWKGAVHEDDETVLIVKTSAALVEPLTAAVKALHSYECPCIVVLDIEPGNAAYFAWLAESLV